MFRVMRTHSHTDRQQLWSVESRPFEDVELAKDWLDFVRSEYARDHPKGKHKFFNIEVLAD